jgi:hypothetical protein
MAAAERSGRSDPARGVAVWFFNRNRLLFNNWEEANKRTTQLGRALG